MITLRLDTDGKLTLPPDYLELLDLMPGDEVRVEVENGRIFIENAAPDGWEEAEIQAAIDEVLNDPRPSVPAEEAFARIFARIETLSRERNAA